MPKILKERGIKKKHFFGNTLPQDFEMVFNLAFFFSSLTRIHLISVYLSKGTRQKRRMCKQKSKTDSKKDIMERQREHFWKAIEFICTELMKIHLVFKSKYSLG